ncbi:hypothetical protein PHJA_000072400 [Phtheirospermum japonicum]|uniref:Uncharacterized protein n=1 Tax=Phtheirospermum japonicum TaxID=374723 RepID=A0A830B1T3_9LAMI|nr:hypothetical protein PHJA_000072400 [Phtheirospermum japonicum]
MGNAAMGGYASRTRIPRAKISKRKNSNDENSDGKKRSHFCRNKQVNSVGESSAIATGDREKSRQAIVWTFKAKLKEDHEKRMQDLKSVNDQ